MEDIKMMQIELVKMKARMFKMKNYTEQDQRQIKHYRRKISECEDIVPKLSKMKPTEKRQSKGHQ